MKKSNILLLTLFFFCANILSAQLKYEKEFRIRKSQFPEKALLLVLENVTQAKKLKFYKEINASEISFDAKFKKDRLWYNIQFSEDGVLENITLKINSIDIPEESYKQMTDYLKNTFNTYKIKNIQQQYLVDKKDSEILKIAFQNLITPNIKYELTIQGKKNKKNSEEFQVLFDSDGKCIASKKSLPPNYDHILY